MAHADNQAANDDYESQKHIHRKTTPFLCHKNYEKQLNFFAF
jgi:hypothetical protein